MAAISGLPLIREEQKNPMKSTTFGTGELIADALEQGCRTFINGKKWEDEVSKLDVVSKITKEDVVAWANKTFTADALVTVYKRQGEDKNQK